MDVAQFVRGEMVVVAIFFVGEKVCVDVVDGWLRDLDLLAFAWNNTINVAHSRA
jgi:hypothetical protein